MAAKCHDGECKRNFETVSLCCLDAVFWEENVDPTQEFLIYSQFQPQGPVYGVFYYLLVVFLINGKQDLGILVKYLV